MEMAKFLVEQWPKGIADRDQYSETPLHWAALMGEIDMVRFLVERWRAGMIQRDYCKNTPLHLAAAEGKTDVVRYLVQQWPEGMRERNSPWKTPLQLLSSPISRGLISPTNQKDIRRKWKFSGSSSGSPSPSIGYQSDTSSENGTINEGDEAKPLDKGKKG
jgi:hypothetical protein